MNEKIPGGTRFLDAAQVRELVELEEVLEDVREAFLEDGKGGVQMPPKSYLDFPSFSGDFRSMPAYLPGKKIAGVKLVNVHRKNPSLGIPTVMALIFLVDPETGFPLAVMEGTRITALRTGAAAATASAVLARKDSRVLGILGAGVQSETQILAHAQKFSLQEVILFDLDSARCHQRIEALQGRIKDVKWNIAKRPQEICAADILVTITPSREAVLRDEWIRPGTHINAVGADAAGKQELEHKILKRSAVYVDSVEQAVHSGEINTAIQSGAISLEDIRASLGEVLAGKKEGRRNEEEITIFDTTGLAILDVAVAARVYRKAVEKEVGSLNRLLQFSPESM